MGQPITAPAKYRFGSFELDPETGELRKRGVRIKLQDQPFRILCILLENRGEVVSREVLCKGLWPDNTFVEFERSLNAAVAKLRQALGDSADSPRFIETLARRGYRFVAPVELVRGVNTSPPNQATPSPVPTDIREFRKKASPRAVLVAGSGFAIIVATVIVLVLHQRGREGASYTVLHRITSDTGLTEDPVVSRDGTLLAYASDRDGSGHLSIWVQRLSAANSAIRLANSDADDHQPSFSPDGSQIVFRSENDGGGIYVVPSLGGDPRLIVRDGHNPTFSPDGRWIAYWVGIEDSSSLNGGAVFVIPSSGGVPQRLQTDMALAYPVWCQDSQHLLVLGAPYLPASFDWWVFPLNGGKAVQTGAFKILKQQGFPVDDEGAGFSPRATEWVGGDVLFSARLGDTVNTWSIHVPQASWHAEHAAQRLSAGGEFEDHPHLLPDGRLVFAGLRLNSNVWSVEADSNQGVVRNKQMKPLTTSASLEQFGSISEDGRYLVFTSTRSGIGKTWLKNLNTGQESRLGTSDDDESHPEISRDGTMVVYSRTSDLSVVPRLHIESAESVCNGCAWVWDWSPDNQNFVYNDAKAVWGFGLFNVRTKRAKVTLAGHKWPLYQARFSPDGKWLAFGQARNFKTSSLFITPIHDEVAGGESEWIPIADDTGWCDKPRWSPDGKLIYFISHRDGHRCLWAQRVDSDTKHPIGQPFSIVHFHSARLSMMNVPTGNLEIDVAKGKIIFDLGEVTGNVWVVSKK